MSDPTSRLFDLLKAHFGLGNEYTFSLMSVEVPEELHDYRGVAAFTLRKTQALHHIAQPGIPAAADVVVGLAGEMCRSLPDLADHVDDPVVEKEILSILDQISYAAMVASQVRPNDGDPDRIVIFE